MAYGFSGPELHKMREELKEWFAKTRLEYIEASEEGHPYGSVPLSNAEQVSQFMTMVQGPDQFATMVASLYERYRGLPDAAERVDQDINRYINHMKSMMMEIGQVRGQ